MRPAKIALFVLLVLCFASNGARPAGEPEITPGNIPYTHFTSAVNNITLHRFTEDSALMKLFPGKFYKITDYGDTFTFESWNCHEWPMAPFTKTLSFDAPDSFPYTGGNDTRIAGMQRYTGVNGNQFILFATSTIPSVYGELIPCGRFSCAQLGIAIFEHTANAWVLRAFNPNVVCTGNYSTAPVPELLKCGNRVYACMIDHANGGAGGPYYGEIFVIGIDPGNLHVLLYEDGTYKGFSPISGWNSDITCIPSTHAMPDIVLTTKGNYSINAEEDDSTGLKPLLNKTVMDADTFGFTVKQNYHYINGRYYQTGKKVSIKK